MATCDVSLLSLGPSCDALRRSGGVRKSVYFGQRSAFNYTLSGTGAVSAIAMIGSHVLYKLTGRKFKHTADFEMKRNDNGTVRYAHNVKLKAPVFTMDERNAVEALNLADDLVFFVPGNDGTITVYGLDEGIEMSVHKGSQGLQLGDNVDQEAEFSGDVEKAPVLLEPTGAATDALRIAYLEDRMVYVGDPD